MKILFLVLFVLTLNNSFGAPCNGAPGYYFRNPDGSSGGFVQKTASVSKESYISADSEVCDKVIITGRPKVEMGSRIGEGALIQGSPTIRDSHVYGISKISGNSYLEEAEVCQGSVIESLKLIKSNYYCQTEDSAPKDPGELGKKTLLGVDSDADGVRDDVEVYINNSLPNTLKQNKSTERIATKFLAKILQHEILLITNNSKIKELSNLKVELHSCYNLTQSENVYAEMYNTEPRLYSLFKIAGVMHGDSNTVSKFDCKNFDYFRAKLALITK